MLMDTNLRVCGCEASSVAIYTKIEAKVPKWPQKPSQHQIFENFSMGSMPPDPPTLILSILLKYRYKSRTNPILLPPGLIADCLSMRLMIVQARRVLVGP